MLKAALRAGNVVPLLSRLFSGMKELTLELCPAVPCGILVLELSPAHVALLLVPP